MTGSVGPDDGGNGRIAMTHPAPVLSERRKRFGGRRGLGIGVVVAVVVLIGAGVGTWVAIGHSGASGSGDPRQAVEQLMTDIGNDDLIGVVNDLPPTEASLVSATLNGLNDHLKRIDVVKPKVTAQDAVGLTLRTNGIRFADSAVEQVNDHIAITKLVGGTITIGSRLSAGSYTADFLRTAFPQGVSATSGATTLDIGQQARRLGHPVRIATVKVDGLWYPSLLYSIADSVLRQRHQPWPARAIPAIGADIANEAAGDFLQAVLNGDARLAIEHTDPDEMAALHDMGQALVRAIHLPAADRVRIIHVAFDDRRVPGGINAVITTLDFVVHGQRVNVRFSDGCYTVQAGGELTSLCAGDFADAVHGTPLEGAVPRPVVQLVDDMFDGLVRNGVGIVTSEIRTLWYVNPGLTATQLASDVYTSVQARHLAQALRLMSESE
jgi:hypothetical protein